MATLKKSTLPTGAKTTTNADRKAAYDAALHTGLEKIFLKFRINEKRWEELKNAGVAIIKRDEKEITQNNIKDAKKFGINAFAYNRKDAAGNKRADSGTMVLEDWDIYADDLLQSLIELGWTSSINMYRKTGEKVMGFAVIVFEHDPQPYTGPDGENPPSTPLNTKILDIIREKLSKRVYEHLQVWRNPNGTCTFNFSHATDEKPKKSLIVEIEEQEENIIPFELW